MQKKISFHPVLILLTLVFITTGCFTKRDKEPQQMNVLFLISDDLRTETGSYGGIAITPNLDRLAKSGVQFDYAYCQYPLCNPSRTSMLFGRSLVTTRLFSNRAWMGDRQPDWVSLPMWFRQHGYTTMRAGKVFHGGIDDTKAWSEGGEKRRHGIDTAPEPDGTTPQPRPKRSGAPGLSKREYSDRWAVLEGENGEEYGDYMVADLAIDYLQRAKDQEDPWFIVCGFSKPHSPLVAPQRFFDMYNVAEIELSPDFASKPTVPEGFPSGSIRPKNADLFIGREASVEQAKEMKLAYYASTSWMDWNAGRVLDELDRLGMKDNTIIVFWGDHGYQLGEKGKWSKAGSIWERGCRVPTIIYDPRVAGNGKSSPRITQSIDLYPTLVDLCNLPVPEGIEGLSLKPLLEDPQIPWEHPAFTVWSENGSTASGQAVDGATMTGVSVRTEQWHYAEFYGRGPGAMLLDPVNDPYEMNNLANDPAYADVCSELSKLVHEYAGGLTAPDEVEDSK